MNPQWLLDLMLRLLPAWRRDWAHAMRAEFDSVVTQRERWSFAIGCATTVLREVSVVRSLGYNTMTLTAVVGIVLWSKDIADARLRWTVIATVAALALVVTLGRVRGPLGPVAATRTARLIRAAGLVTVTAVTISVLSHVQAKGDPSQDQRFAMAMIGAVLVCYLFGFVAATAGASAATDRALRRGAASGAAAALVWLIMVVANSSVPFGASPALAILGVAVPIGAAAAARDATQGWIAALAAGTTGTLLMVIELVLASRFAPARMIPSLAPAALTAADNLAQSRAELVDPYVFLFILGGAIALALGVISLRRRPIASPVPGFDGRAGGVRLGNGRT